MRSTSRRLPEEAGSALDDSTFEFLETSDDEGHTESIASTDGCTPDDASSFSDDDDDYDARASEVQHSTPSLPAEASEDHNDTRSIHSTGDSIMTEVPAYARDSGLSSRIRLEEGAADEAGVISGSKVIRSFPDERGQTYRIIDKYQWSQVRLVVKAAMSQHSIPTPDSYRILFIGSISSYDEDAVIKKIIAALTSSQSTSRSHMVSGQLEPYGPVILRDRSASIKVLSEDGERARIAISVDEDTYLTFESGRTSPSELRPDLAIFCHSSEPNVRTKEFATAHEVFDRENIPYLDLISARQYHHGSHSYNSRSLSICVEGRNDPESDYEFIELLELDYWTFSELEPSQVNRHLAAISPHMRAAAQTKTRASRSGDLSRAPNKKLGATPRAPRQVLILLMLLTGMISTYLFGPVLMPMFSELVSSNRIAPPALVPEHEYCSSTASLAVTSAPTASPASPSLKLIPRDLTVMPPQPKTPKQGKAKSKKSISYEIKATSEHEFMLVPHKDILTARKKPQLQIEVTRASKLVPIHYNRTISGVYVVYLDQQHPYGTFDVTIASYSKPLLQQSFEIVLGHNRSTFAQLFDTTRSALHATQVRVLEASSRTKGEVLAKLASAEMVARIWGREAKKLGKDITSDFGSATEKMISRLGMQTRMARDIPGVAWSGLQRATAPVRTSSPMLRARLNALRMRCKLEMATGLSGRSKDGTQSWACSKVRN
ncbi:hypothetical protein BKA63DRAFT_109800 [Paraphoma chrysanthemicola]|nr:hypothetical protein BKA63DRAFT_109800 [Paraphoma chrysanthemicola]